MIGAGDGGVEGADAVFEEADAVTAEPANDRAAGPGTERGGVNAGFGAEGIAEGSLLFKTQGATTEDGGGLGEVGLVAFEGRGGGDKLVECHHAVGVGGGGWRVRMSGRRWRRDLGAGVRRECRSGKEEQKKRRKGETEGGTEK